MIKFVPEDGKLVVLVNVIDVPDPPVPTVSFGKAPINEVAPIPTPKEKLANPTKKQTQSLETEKTKRAEEDIFDPTPNEPVELDPTMPVEVTPLTNQPMTSVFYSD